MQLFRIFSIILKFLSFITIFIIIFYKFFIRLWCVFSPSKLSIGNFWDLSHQYKLFASHFIVVYCSYYLLLQMDELRDIFHLLFLFLPFVTLILVNNLIPFQFFSGNACHPNPGAEKKWARSSSYVSIHLLLKFSNTCNQHV